jgi:hypothetical protein
MQASLRIQYCIQSLSSLDMYFNTITALMNDYDAALSMDDRRNLHHQWQNVHTALQLRIQVAATELRGLQDDFTQWPLNLRKHHPEYVAPAPVPAPRAIVDGEEGCCVCFVNFPNATFSECQPHTAGICSVCAARVVGMGMGCPLCRGAVSGFVGI